MTEPREPRVRRNLTIVGFLLAITVLAGAYLLRWTYLGPIARNAVEAGIESAIGNGIDVTVGQVGGTLVRDVWIAAVSTDRPASTGFIRRLSVDNLVVRYRLSDALAMGLAFVLPRRPARNSDDDLAWLRPGSVGIADVVGNLANSVPEELEISASGVIEGDPSIAPAPVKIEVTRNESNAALVIVDLFTARAPWFGTDTAVELSLGLYGADGLLDLRTVAPASDPALRVSLRSREEEGATVLSLLSASAKYGALHARIWADQDGATADVTLEDRESPLPDGWIDAALVGPITVGDLDMSARVTNGGGASIVGGLVSTPVATLRDTTVAVEVTAGEWRFQSFELSTMLARVRWQRGVIDLSTAELSLDTRPADSNGEERAVRLDIDGSIRLDEGETILDRVRGDLAGRLTISDPQSVWAALANRGVVPLLPEGFAPGSAVVAEVGVRGARGETPSTLAFEIVVGDPVVAGYAIDEAKVTGVLGSRRLTLQSADVSGGRADATVSGVPGPSDVDLSLGGPVTVTWSDGSVSVSPFEVLSNLGTISGSGRIEGTNADISLQLEELPFAVPLTLVDSEAAASASGTITARTTVTGPLALPDMEVEALGNDLRIAGEAAEISISAVQRDGSITVTDARIAVPSIAVISAKGQVPFAVGSSGLVRGSDSESGFTASGTIEAVSRLLGDSAASALGDASVQVSVEIDANGAALDGTLGPIPTGEASRIAGAKRFESFAFSASVGAAAESIPISARLIGRTRSAASSADETSADTTSADRELARVSGRLLATTSALAGTAIADIGVEGRIEASLPLAELSPLVRQVELLGGSADAAIDVTGRLGDVSTAGTMRLRNGTVKLATIVPTISDIGGVVHFAGDRLFTESISAQTGGQELVVAGELSRSDNADLTGSVSLTGSNLLLARSPDFTVRSDVRVHLSVDGESLQLSGRVDATAVEYRRPVQVFSLGTSAAAPTEDIELFQISDSWARNLSLDVRFVSDRTIRVNNNLYNGTLSADARLGGTAAVPRPNGRIFGDGGTVQLPTTALSVEQVEVLFPSTGAFRPEVFLDGRTEIRGFEMAVTAHGRMPDVEVDIISTPPLPTDEALVLLTTGQRPGELDFTADATGTITAFGTVLGRSLYEEISGSLPEESRAFLDRLDFRIEQAEESGTIGDVEVEYRLADGEEWFLLFDRTEEETFSVQLAWRLWIE